MKKILVLILAMGFSITSFAANHTTSSGNGCNAWGPVSFVYVPESGTSLSLINGSACFVSGLTPDGAHLIASVLSEALTSGKDVNLSVVNGQVHVATQ